MKQRKLWSSGTALGSQSEVCGFDPRPILDGSGVKAMPGLISTHQFWIIIENTGNQMGHTKKKLFKYKKKKKVLR